MMSETEGNERLAIVAKLRPGSRERAKEILAEGPRTILQTPASGATASS